MLVSPSRNPVRNQLYEAQIEYYHLPIKKRTLQAGLKRYTKGAQRYKIAFVKKRISAVNKQKRASYGFENQNKTIEEYWQYYIFTDEFYIDPSSTAQGNILRERGTRTDPENIQEQGEKTGVKLHVAGWVSWHTKCDKLEFYNDEQESIIKPRWPCKPRTRKYESAEEWEARIRTWEEEIAALPYDVEVKPKGNAMTQKYYTERLLPVYIKAVEDHRKLTARNEGFPTPWVLQEDNDPSHGHKVLGLAQRLKIRYWIPTIVHPPQSPDLNPIKACWNIIKPRIRRRT